MAHLRLIDGKISSVDGSPHDYEPHQDQRNVMYDPLRAHQETLRANHEADDELGPFAKFLVSAFIVVVGVLAVIGAATLWYLLS